MSQREQILQIPLDRLRVPPARRVETYSAAEIASLAAAIRATGAIEHPVIVRLSDDHSGQYEVVAGGLRVAAATRLRWETVPCRVRDIPASLAHGVGLIENLARRREKLLPLGWALVEAMEATGWTKADFAAVTLRSPSTITEAVKAATAIPEHVLAEVATEYGIPHEVACRLGRTPLRKL